MARNLELIIATGILSAVALVGSFMPYTPKIDIPEKPALSQSPKWEANPEWIFSNWDMKYRYMKTTSGYAPVSKDSISKDAVSMIDRWIKKDFGLNEYEIQLGQEFAAYFHEDAKGGGLHNVQIYAVSVRIFSNGKRLSDYILQGTPTRAGFSIHDLEGLKYSGKDIKYGLLKTSKLERPFDTGD